MDFTGICERRDPRLPLFLLSFCWTLLQLPLNLAAPGFGPCCELTTVASNLAASGEYRDPFGLPTGPTAHVAPVYTFILAGAIKLFRDPVTVTLAMSVFNAVLFGTAAALMPVLSRRIYGRSAPGVAGGVLLAFSGWLMPQWETALSSALLLAATLVILQGGALHAGIWSGVCLLTNPATLPPLAVLVVFRKKSFTVALVAMMICSPWILRNWRTLGYPYFVRDNLGLELYISNHDRAAPEFVANWPLWHVHPNQNPEEARLVASMGEGPYNQMRLRDTFEWISRHPGLFLKLSAARAFYYWFPSPVEGWPAYPYWIISLCGGLGAWASRNNRLVRALGLAAVSYSLLFILIGTHVRYRFPSLWMAALLSGFGAIEIAGYPPCARTISRIFR
jgi:hypothetical protein